MAQYDTALVCLNGHMVNSRSTKEPEHNEQRCSKCGEPTIAKCPQCGAPIKGSLWETGTWGRGSFDWKSWPSKPSSYCHTCGKAYPWTERKIQGVKELIDELDELTAEEKTKLKKSIPDIIAETPDSEVAVLRFKKAAAKVGKVGGKLLTDILAKVAAETIKKQMGLW